MFHYNYLKEDNISKMTGTNYFLKNLSIIKKQNKIKELKEFLYKNKINVRI